MAWEKGILTDIEEQAIAVLIALADDNGDPLFKNIEDNAGTFQQIAGEEKCVNHWLGQIGPGDGGIASFERYTPFAFIRTSIDRVKREGDYDANLQIVLDVAVGQDSVEQGVCRIGDTTHVGINRIFEKVFLAFDGWHPGSGIACDDFYLNDALPIVTTDKKAAIQVRFVANWIPVSE